MWSVQVTGSLRVLKPVACTASIKIWLGAGFPKLVTVGSPSKELPRFHPGGMSFTICCGVPPEVDPPDELLPDVPSPEELPEELPEPDEVPAGV